MNDTRHWIRLVSMLAAIGLGTALAIALPAGQAVGQQSPPQPSMEVVLPDQGTVTARGLILTIPLQITCAFPGTFNDSEIQVSVRQAQGLSIVEGRAFANLSSTDCDGTPHTVNVTVQPENAPFRPGSAVASAFAFVCYSDPATGFACISDSDGPKAIALRQR
jgi:hypothetical protein